MPSQKYQIVTLEGKYRFITDNNVIYDILLSKSPTLINDKQYKKFIYEISFYCNEINIPPDYKIKNTIISFLENFFNQNQNNILFYICESGDNKHLYRNRLFEKWFNEYASKHNIEKINALICVDEFEIEYYISTIIKRSNPFKTEFKKDFIELIDSLESEKK